MRKWNKPSATVQEFTANEYVAACYAYSDTGIVVTAMPTDGKLTTPGKSRTWNGKGFNDDGFDFLAGEDDTIPSGRKGWYGTASALSVVHSASKGPQEYTNGLYGNHAAQRDNAMATPVYYFGKNASDPVQLTKATCGKYGVGPNAS